MTILFDFNTLWRSAVACLFAQGLSACAPAPVAVSTPVPVPESYREQATGVDASGDALAAAWWTVFRDDRLDALERRARLGNPSLQQAVARVERAAAALGARAADSQPRVGAAIGATRQVGPLINAAGAQGNFFNAELRLSVDVDLLQRLSRAEQAAEHDVRAQQALHRQAQLVLEVNVAHSELEWRAVRLEQRALEQALQADRELLAMAERRVQSGLAAPMVRTAARVQWQVDEVEWQRLDRRKAVLEHALTALIGVSEPAVEAVPSGDALPSLPSIPVGLPSQMLQRRGDVTAAEQAMQSARLRLGLARDAWFPQITLTANAGLASGELGQWLSGAARSTGIGLLLSLPGLDGGRADALRAAAAADLHLATAEHRERVFGALREVDDQLAALRTLAAEAAARQAGAEDAERDADRLVAQWRSGLNGGIEALQTQREARLQQRLWIQARSAQQQATVDLVRALGGGWGQTDEAARLAAN
ncbi:MAG: efflux transporter outer membrane subunit [Rhizobacter sp.]